LLPALLYEVRDQRHLDSPASEMRIELANSRYDANRVKRFNADSIATIFDLGDWRAAFAQSVPSGAVSDIRHSGD
jgi:hypothetical protein